MANLSLDYRFLRHIGVNAASQERTQRYYLRFFADRRDVLDLACGDGDFVALLRANGVPAIGIERDPAFCREAARRGIPLQQGDVFEFLAQAGAERYDGMFTAHLVEHLPYPRVLELFGLAFHALRPGGILVVATPNARSLYAHLEDFYKHFSHVTFYHPDLLGFLLSVAGFTVHEVGENTLMPAPLFGDLRLELERLRQGALPPPKTRNPLRRLRRRVEVWTARYVLRSHLGLMTQVLDAVMARVDRPFEAYAVGVKPAPESKECSASRH